MQQMHIHVEVAEVTIGWGGELQGTRMQMSTGPRCPCTRTRRRPRQAGDRRGWHCTARWKGKVSRQAAKRRRREEGQEEEASILHLHATHSHSVTSTQRNKRSRCSLAQTPEPRETERLAAQRVKNVVPVRGTRRPRQASERNRQEGSPYSCGCSGHTQEPLRHV